MESENKKKIQHYNKFIIIDVKIRLNIKLILLLLLINTQILLISNSTFSFSAYLNLFLTRYIYKEILSLFFFVLGLATYIKSKYN